MSASKPHFALDPDDEMVVRGIRRIPDAGRSLEEHVIVALADALDSLEEQLEALQFERDSLQHKLNDAYHMAPGSMARHWEEEVKKLTRERDERMAVNVGLIAENTALKRKLSKRPPQSADHLQEQLEAADEFKAAMVRANQCQVEQITSLREQLEATHETLRALWNWVGSDQRFAPLEVERQVIAALESNPASESS